VPREGLASSALRILKLCSRPSCLRRVTVLPKDAVHLSAGAFDGLVGLSSIQDARSVSLTPR
jgi:hypothetical protein